MNDFWYRFKSQPWRDLALASLLAIAIATIVEILLVTCVSNSTVCRDSVELILAPPMNQIFFIAIAVGIGALGVYLCENWERVGNVSLNNGSLWALVLCLMLAIGFKSLLIRSFIFGLNQISLIGIIVGVFWKGRPYWR